MATASGAFLGYNNNRGNERLKEVMNRALSKFREYRSEEAEKLSITNRDPNRNIAPPDGTIVVDVNARVLDGYKATTKWTRVFHDAISQDHLWILKDEVPDLVSVIQDGGVVPDRIAKRIVRFNLVDNTRGEPPRWSNKEVIHLKLAIDSSGTLTGNVHLETKSGDRGYVAELFGKVEADGTTVTRFDVVCKGMFWGSGPYTHHPPEGNFPLVVAFRLADQSKRSANILPYGAKGMVSNYFESEK